MKKFITKYRDELKYIAASVVMLAAMLASVKLASMPKMVSPTELSLPILRFTAVDDSGSEYAVPTNIFWYHMKALQDARYNTVFFSDVVSYVENGSYLPQKAVLVTFDGVPDSFEEVVLPALEEFNIKVTVLLPTCMEQGDHEHDDLELLKRISDSELVELSIYPDGVLLDENFELQKYTSKCYSGVDVVSYVTGYPSGRYSDELDLTLKNKGVSCTVLDTDGISVLTKKDMSTLLRLKRLTVTSATAPVDIIRMCYTGKYK